MICGPRGRTLVPRRKFEPKREKVTGGWGILHNEELQNLYSPVIVKSDQGECDKGGMHRAC
jgi:hypothetical protein